MGFPAWEKLEFDGGDDGLAFGEGGLRFVLGGAFRRFRVGRGWLSIGCFLLGMRSRG